jgi:ribosomal protein L13E
MNHDDVPLSEHARRLSRAWRAVVVGALAGTALGLLDVASTPPVYGSTTSVLVADVPTFLPDRTDPNPRRFTMDTEARRVTSAPVLAALGRAVGDPAPLDNLLVTATPTTKVLRVTYRSRGDATAVRGAQAAAEAYLGARGRALESRRDNRVAALRQELRTLDDRLGETAVSTPTAAVQRVRRIAISRRIAERQAEIRTVEAMSVFPGEIVRRVELTAGERRNKTVPVTGGFAVGALLGAAVTALRATRLRTPVDVMRAVPGPAVASAGPGPTRSLDPVVSQLAAGPGVFVVAPADAASVMASHEVSTELAVRLSGTGRTTLVVRTENGQSGPQPQPEVPEEHLDVQRGDAHTAAALAVLRQATAVDQHLTTVLVDAPPVTGAVGSLLATLTDGTVLVASTGTRAHQLTATARWVTGVGASVTGVVLTPRPAKPSRRGGRR